MSSAALALAGDRRGAIAHFADLLRSELCKFRSVRWTFWALLAAVAFNIGLAALLAIFLPGQLSTHELTTLDVTRVSLGGVHLSQIALGVLGVLVITSEYSTGMIYATLAAVPQRRLVLGAKAVVFAASAFAVAALASFGAYFTFKASLSTSILRTSLSDPGVARALIGGGLYPAVLGLLGLGLGAILRSSAAAIATLFGLLFVPPILLELLPHSLRTTIGPYVPMEAGDQIFSVQHSAGSLSPWAGFGVLCLYAALALLAGFALIKRRDA
jgi:ABC-2 type transport system permease protein